VTEERRDVPTPEETEPPRPDEDLDEDEIAEEGGGGGKLGLIIIGLLVVGLLVVAYLNKRSYEGRSTEPPVAPDNTAVAPGAPKAPTGQAAPEPPQLTPEQWYRQAVARNRDFALREVFRLGDRVYTAGKHTRSGPEGVRMGWLFDTTRLARGVKREHLYRRLLAFGPVYADTFTPLGLPDGPKGVFKTAGEAGLDDKTGGIGLAIGTEAAFYPFRFLNWHEVVNDTVGGVPVVVVWSSLAQAPLALDRRIEGKTLTFGSAGLVYQGAIVIYDTDTHSLWSPVTGRGLTNRYADRFLKPLQAATVRWKVWREKHPQARALTGVTPDQKIDYRRNVQLPHPDYRRMPAPAHPVEGYDVANEALPMKVTVIGVEAGGKHRAYPYALLMQMGEIADTLGGVRLTLRYDRDTGLPSVTDAEGRSLLYRTMYWIVWKGNFPDSDAYVPSPQATGGERPGAQAPAPPAGKP